MKKLVAAAGIGAALATTVGIAAPAHADGGSDFINEVRAAGFSNVNGNWALLAQGRAVCTDLDHGYSPATVATNYFYVNSVSNYDAGRFVGISMRELCPWHVGQGFYENVVA